MLYRMLHVKVKVIDLVDEVAKPLVARVAYKWKDSLHIGIPIYTCSNNDIDIEMIVDNYWPLHLVLYEKEA